MRTHLVQQVAGQGARLGQGEVPRRSLHCVRQMQVPGQGNEPPHEPDAGKGQPFLIGHRLAQDAGKHLPGSLLPRFRFAEETSGVPLPEQTAAEVVDRQTFFGYRFGRD